MYRDLELDRNAGKDHIVIILKYCLVQKLNARASLYCSHETQNWMTAMK